jgi:hypothetical protein
MSNRDDFEEYSGHKMSAEEAEAVGLTISSPTENPQFRKSWESKEYKSPTCCPFCGGDRGFQYTWTEKLTTFYDWEGFVWETSEGTPVYTGKFRCSDCKRVVEKYIKVTEVGKGGEQNVRV